MSVQIKSLEPLLRLAAMRPDLVRFAPRSHTRELQTVPLADTPLAQGLGATFDDTCFLTVPAGELDKLAHVKLAAHAGKARFAGVHLAFLSMRGQMTVLLGDDQAKLIVGTDTNVRAHIQMFGKPRLFIGDRTTIAQARLIVANADVVIGEDCQFADDVILQSSEQHPITDLDTGEPINARRRSVHVDRHVLVGRRAMLLPDVRLGEGAIVEAGAVVTQDVAANTLVGGAPARVLRERVAWSR
ncbi:MAG: acyltransferase [Burkholderiaceae bacterium]